VLEREPTLRDAISAALQPQHDHAARTTLRGGGSTVSKVKPTAAQSAISDAFRHGTSYLGDGSRDAL
jgi:hypothetical protein